MGFVLREEWDPLVTLLGLLAAVAALPASRLLYTINGAMALLLGHKVYRAVRRADRLLREKHIPVMVVIGRSEEEAATLWGDVQRAMVRWEFDAERYRRDFDVEREDVLLHDPAALPAEPDAWLQTARDFRRMLERAGARLPGRRVFHVFIKGPVALAAGLGASVGTMQEVVVHHWMPGTEGGPYHPVADFHALSASNPGGMHRLEDAVAGETRYVVAEGEITPVQELLVSIKLGRDDPRDAVNRLAEIRRSQGASVGALHIAQREARTLEIGDDWILCARETLTLLRDGIARSRADQVHLFMSTPVALAFTLGMGIEHFMPVTIHHWESEEREYHPVLPLPRLARSHAPRPETAPAGRSARRGRRL
jgi:hypothetical protein